LSKKESIANYEFSILNYIATDLHHVCDRAIVR
jgi:hypothetical protein